MPCVFTWLWWTFFHWTLLLHRKCYTVNDLCLSPIDLCVLLRLTSVLLPGVTSVLYYPSLCDLFVYICFYKGLRWHAWPLRSYFDFLCECSVNARHFIYPTRLRMLCMFILIIEWLCALVYPFELCVLHCASCAFYMAVLTLRLQVLNALALHYSVNPCVCYILEWPWMLMLWIILAFDMV